MVFFEKNNSLITNDLFFILDLIEKSEEEARIVGGAVRNFLLGVDIFDVDIATTAVPEKIVNLFQKNGIHTTPIGIEHGTVLISYNGKSYEITTLREDVETFGRQAKVSFTKSFQTDSCRRDFTINAIYMDKNGKMFDYHSGIQDVSSRNIRFVGDARKRIMEDYLRILRYFRFTAYYGNYIPNEEYLEVINSLKKNMSILSSERIISELLKIFSVADSFKIIPMMREVLNELFDLKIDPLYICEKLKLFSSMPNTERLSMLLKFSKLSVDQLVQRYNFAKDIKGMLRLPSVDSPKEIRHFLKYIKKAYRKFFAKYSIVKLCAGNHISETSAQQLIKGLLGFCDSEYVDFNLKAKDLSKYNLSDNSLRKVMMAAKQFWLKSKTDVSAEDCLNYAVDYIDRNI
ncbi:MAG: CCA tRNA nucleotidyltransferase [Holosporaceae bacterium]|jgi:tRNA nucleotidyltransferase/poly(A) polymerase|nr:CCA tRNA nucleotidyltransferase [Holosporaceae bacterium]